MKDLITGAEALMRSLEHQGVTTIFGYPGGSIMPVFDALYDHQNILNHILVRHEQGAAHAAQGYARVSGDVGVCLVTSGPGATNTVTGIADAMIDSTPIVVIAGQVGTGFLGTDAFQEVDLVGITQPIAKWSYQIRRAEDVKKILYAGAKRAMLNFSKALSIELIEEVSKRFGKERIAVSLNDFDALFKQQHLIEAYSTEMIFMHRLDLNSVVNVTETQCVVVTDTMDENEILNILKSDGVKGVSGRFISRLDMDFNKFKEVCAENGIQMTSFESQMDFGEFKLNSDGLIPVIVQDYKTNEVLMLAYMTKESFEKTLETGKMTYFSRSRQELWTKGDTSGHYQYVKSLDIDCDKDTILAKVEQIGAACHTGNRTCFFTRLAQEE